MADKMDFIYRKKTASQRRGFTKAAEPPPGGRNLLWSIKKPRVEPSANFFGELSKTYVLIKGALRNAISASSDKSLFSFGNE